MKKNKNKTKKVIFTVSLITILFSLITYAYYTNTNKFFDDSRKNDGFGGEALERDSEDFIVNGCGAGTMLDTVTGLCWDKNMSHAGSTKQWATNNTYAKPTWNDTTKIYSYPNGKANYPAFVYCEDLTIDDKDDWRLPTRNELMTLIDEIGGSGSTCISLIGFGFSNCQDNYYWTQDEYKSSTSYVWLVYFSSGLDGTRAKTDYRYVVCVR